jgi:TRAP-type C4-dicarboxylate transport system substrate-binding protein
MERRRHIALVVLALVVITALLVGVVGCNSGSKPADKSADTTANKPADKTAVEPIEWKLNVETNPSGTVLEGYKNFASEIEKRTGGRLKITIYPNAHLGFKGADSLQLVSKGETLVMSEVVPAYFPAVSAPTHALDAPGLGRNVQEWGKAVAAAKPILDKYYAEKWNVVQLAVAPWPGAYYYSKKPLATVADLKGLKIRSYSKTYAAVAQSLGAAPVSMPAADIYTALQRGTVDAVHTALGTVVSLKLYESLKYINKWPIGVSSTSILVNKTALENLPEDIRKVVIEVGEETNKFWLDNAEQDEQAQLKELEAKGMKVVEPSPADQQKMTAEGEKALKEWAQKVGSPASDMINAALAAVGRK